jgi:hypothetical protein
VKQTFLILLILSLTGLAKPAFGAGASDPALQAKVEAQIKVIQAWVSDPAILNAVKAQNASLPPEYAAMTQDKWKDLSKLDPLVRSFDKNPAGVFLKSKKSDTVIRSFLSDAAGRKVAFTAKTLSWSHQGDPKHELPMTGKTWEGAVEQDKASGREQIQIAVPVLDGDKPIGSLVVSLSIANL